MTDPIVYIPTPSEDGPGDGRIVYGLHAYINIEALREAKITNWLKPVPLSELMAEKDKEIKARENEVGFLNTRINEYLIELASLKSRVVEIVGKVWEASGNYEYSIHFGRIDAFPDKSTYISNLKKELDI